MENKFIKNRRGQKISVLVEFPKNPRGLAFIMHGLGGFKEIPMIVAMAEAFLKKDIIAFRFDTTNSFGESDGTYELATTTNYYEDLEDVINWAKKQPWYVEPFYLIGHSTGAVCLGTYAKRHPEKIKGLAPLGGVSGELWLKNEPKEGLKKWNKTGWKITPSSKPGTIKKLNWHNYLKDSLDYDLLKNTERVTTPCPKGQGFYE
ncbi:hypothetical protein COU60_01405 [Candidatus Pacearchaeota archaeon CG10_big_fil_rev_8_21_14_0_10_34_76]|nr:MAG: hypothetical protein COU60_01405 [Candidatus Pacearchaeota archaeon CG10_big_fil_rev_8_21_14_0_10_34_76]